MNSHAAPDLTTGNRPPAAPRYDVWVVLGSLFVLTALSWGYLLHLADAMADMAAMPGMPMQPQPWTAVDAWFAFVMWSVMMVGMMLPSATPMILLFTRLQSQAHAGYARTLLFGSGYLLVWTLFSAIATGLQYALQSVQLLNDAGLTHALPAGLVLMTAGAYQWTSAKQSCLTHCRSPLVFLMSHWRSGRRGALRLGLEHGAYCLGCCWSLMLLLFVGGVMNLIWAAGLGVFVLMEKLLPVGDWLARGVGAVLILWGAWTILAPFA